MFYLVLNIFLIVVWTGGPARRSDSAGGSSRNLLINYYKIFSALFQIKESYEIPNPGPSGIFILPFTADNFGS